MAMQKTLSAPELLENIIVDLPEREILANAQRVSRTWNSLVSSSPTIRTKLWQQSSRKALSPSQFSRNHTTTPQFVPGCPVYPRSTSISLNPLIVRDEYKRTRPKPLLPRFSSFTIPPNSNTEQDRKQAVFTYFDLGVPSDAKHSRWASQFADNSCPSWYSMLITEPPITTAVLGLHDDTEIYTMIYDRVGITLGLIVDVMEAVLRPFCRVVPEDCGDLFSFLAHVDWYEIDGADERGHELTENGWEIRPAVSSREPASG